MEEQQSRPSTALSGYFYRSPVAYELELDALLLKSWIYAAHVSELSEPGAFRTLEIGEDSIIVARGDDGVLRAFSNSCRHRGARVCGEESGVARRFVCPYHGWTYGSDGSLRGAREMADEAGFDGDTLGLRPLRLVEFEGLVFVNADPGSILVGRQRNVCRSWPNQSEVTVPGIHYLQEDSGVEIGRHIAAWLDEVP